MATITSLLVPQGLPAQIAELLQLQRDMLDRLSAIAASVAPLDLPPEIPAQSIHFYVQPDGYATSQALHITSVIFSADTAGPITLRIGEANAALGPLFLEAYSTVQIVFADIEELYVNRGQRVNVVCAAANWSCEVFAKAE